MGNASTIDTNFSAAFRDGSLVSLTNLLNSNSIIFQEWTQSPSDTSNFLQILQPWLISEPAFPISQQFALPSHRPNYPLKCDDVKYSRVLNGRMRSSPRMIIDFVPFGYDVDKLLVRLYESYDFVDTFVIYEFPFSLIGVSKPLYFQLMWNKTMFAPFKDKIVYLYSKASDVEPSIEAMNKAIARGEKKLGDLFAVMFFMEKDMLRQFKLFLNFDSNDTASIGGLSKLFNPKVSILKKKILQGYTTALGIQNDGDELVNGKVLQHLKYCELHANVQSIYTPCFSFKSNYRWLQRNNKDMNCFTGASNEDRQIQHYLKHYLWRDGPFLWPLSDMVQAQWNLRRHHHNMTCHHHMVSRIILTLPVLALLLYRLLLYRSYYSHFSQHLHCTLISLYLQRHLTVQSYNVMKGLGAATHMSATNDPVEYWLKLCGTVENRLQCKNILSEDFITAGRQSKITPELIFSSTIFPWCHKNNYAVHVTSITLPLNSKVDEAVKKRAKAMLEEAVPWIIRAEPASFPFLLPVEGNPAAGLFTRCTQPTWANSCTLGRRRANGEVVEIANELPVFAAAFGAL